RAAVAPDIYGSTRAADTEQRRFCDARVRAVPTTATHVCPARLALWPARGPTRPPRPAPAQRGGARPGGTAAERASTAAPPRGRRLPHLGLPCQGQRPTLLAWGSSSFTVDDLGGSLDDWTSPRPSRHPPALHERPDVLPVVRPALGDTDPLRPRLRRGSRRPL